MFTITSREIFTRRGGGGERFTEFVDSLIRAEAYANGIPLSKISTNLRVNIGDKGVDTAVHTEITNDPTGWLNVPSCWQYKATDSSNISSKELIDEVKKERSTELIQKGYGYRFCICDEITHDKKETWEEILTKEIRTINSSAPLPKVVSASDLADWASRIPAIIVRFFKPGLGQFLHFQAWKNNITNITPKFVEVEKWYSVKQQIIQHIDFSNTCQNVVLPIQGEAGVGKTRLVYETLSTCDGADNLVIYVIDTKAVEIAYLLANDSSTKVILVADECLVQTRGQLSNILQGHSDRIRVIAIDNSGERPSDETVEVWLQRIPDENVDSVLRQNFSNVSSQNRLAYVQLSRGFIRLAADLCRYDFQITRQGNIGSALTNLKDYLRQRLNDKQLKTVEALSLFKRIGYRDDVKQELEWLCQTLHLNKDDIIEAANDLKAPGFVAFAGRYWYITPEIIAQVAFSRAWHKWIAGNPSEFLSKIPENLLESFLTRVSNSGDEEVRRFVGDFFRSWATQLKPLELSDVFKTKRFVTLVAINPSEYLGLLTSIITNASQEELLEISRHSNSSRRSLVWLAERLVSFPEFFFEAELILLHLAIAETEENLTNNATEIWKQIFKIFLSGTSVSFEQRINLLEKRLFSNKEEERNLAIQALTVIFDTQGHRLVGNIIIAGRLRPEDWQPSTESELKNCLDLAFNLVVKASQSNLSQLKQEALNILIKRLPTLLKHKYLEQLKAIFEPSNLPENILLSLIRKLEDYVELSPTQPEQSVKDWLASLIPQDFHGKLINTIGKAPWYFSNDEQQNQWKQEINNFAKQLYEQPELLKSEIIWLGSAQAINANLLGQYLGSFDQKAICLEIIKQAVKENSATELAKGYITGLISHYPEHINIINQWIDNCEENNPEVVYHLSLVYPELTKALDRIIKLIDSDKLSLDYLLGFSYQKLTSSEVNDILQRLISNQSELDKALKFISSQLKVDVNNNYFEKVLIEEPKNQELILEILTSTAKTYRGDAYDWVTILSKISNLNLSKTLEIASSALLGEDDQKRIRATEFIIDVAKSSPELVMNQIGQLFLSEDYQWSLKSQVHRSLVQSLPIDLMKKWLIDVGVIAAQSIASSLPLPYLDKQQNPIVPELTEFVLSTFEDDEMTFRKFCIGSHNMQTYLGDIASQKRKEAEIARKFVNHPLRRIREWANFEPTFRTTKK